MAHRREPPTPRRLARARREGDHPIAPALTALSGLILIAIFLPAVGRALLRQARELLALALRAEPTAVLSELPGRLIWIVAPLLAAVAVAAAVVGVWQTGGALGAASPRRWRWESPFALFRPSWPRASSALMAVGATAALSWVALSILRSSGPALATTLGSADSAARVGAELARRISWWAAGVGLVVAVIDKLVRHQAWLRRHHMSREEVLQEARESEGDPTFRQARRRSHQELIDSLQLARLPAATLVISDGAQRAVALRHDPTSDDAPVVILIASGPLAETVVALAATYRVTVHRDEVLAAALASVAPDHPIPPALYTAVAAALSIHMRRDG